MIRRVKKGQIITCKDSAEKFKVMRMPCADKMDWETSEPFYEIKEVDGSGTFFVSLEAMSEEFE